MLKIAKRLYQSIALNGYQIFLILLHERFVVNDINPTNESGYCEIELCSSILKA